MKLSASVKGWLGECAFRLAKKFALKGSLYQDINNVTLDTGNGTTQIDHIIVSPYGVFVVETKNMKGWIFGSATQPKWTQSFRSATFQFQNPLRQNYRHTQALGALLALPESAFHSIVYFAGGDCTFKTPLPGNVFNSLPFRYIRSMHRVILTDAQVDSAVLKIKASMLPKNFMGFSTGATHREHLASLHERHTNSEICPKCGGRLVLRTVKVGANSGRKFLGCSKFPGCKYANFNVSQN